MVFIFLAVSCSSSYQIAENDNLSVVVDVAAVMKEGWITLDSTLYSVRYVRLDTNEDCLIGTIHKALIFNDRIYVADFTQAMAIFVFDMRGNFLFKIDRRGRGSGEYLSINDFDIDTHGNIYIFDSFNKCFIVYDSIGNFKHTISIEYHLTSFCIVEDIIYCALLRSGSSIIASVAAFNLTDGSINHVIPYREQLDDIRFHSSPFKFYRSPLRTYFNPKFSPVIYGIDEVGFFPAVGLQNLKMPPKDVLAQWSNQPELILNPHDYFIETTYIFETERYLYFRINMGMTISIIYDKEFKRYYHFGSLIYSAGISVLHGSTGKYFWGVMMPDERFHAELMKKQNELKQWKEEDNPIIVFIEFKLEPVHHGYFNPLRNRE